MSSSQSLSGSQTASGSGPAAVPSAVPASVLVSATSVDLTKYLDWTTAPIGSVVSNRLSGKVAVVFGGSSGIGAVSGRRLAAEGAAVVLVARREDRLKPLVKAIQASGGRAAYYVADLMEESSSGAAVEFAVRTFGGLHICFNNLGVYKGQGPLWLVDSKDYALQQRTNVDAVFYAMKAQLPALAKQGGGVIINTSSVAATRPLPYSAALSASKAWVNMITQAAANDAAPLSVRINAIAPGATLSEGLGGGESGLAAFQGFAAKLHLFQRAILPEEVAGLVAYLASDEAVMINGQVIHLDGGMSASAGAGRPQ